MFLTPTDGRGFADVIVDRIEAIDDPVAAAAGVA